MNTGDNSKLDSLKIVQEIVVHKVKDNFQKPEISIMIKNLGLQKQFLETR